MSPLDRIAQLSDENALLRSQLRDAQEQANRDSETIARLAADKSGLADALSGVYKWLKTFQVGDIAPPSASIMEAVCSAISRHA